MHGVPAGDTATACWYVSCCCGNELCAESCSWASVMRCGCRVMLSDKLLSKTDYNCDREIRTLELLKLRFGDANLHNCEASLMHWTVLPWASPTSGFVQAA